MSWIQFQALASRLNRFKARQFLVTIEGAMKGISHGFGDATVAQQVSELRAIAYPGADDTAPMIPNALRDPTA